ncbi:hypothetical protein LLT35_001886 [Vibrio alginolyticus]|nr:hypothetical protein [Vibrio alginolyticus]
MLSLSLEPMKRLEGHVYLFTLLAPLSVTKWNKVVLVVLFLSAALSVGYYFLLARKIKFEKYSLTTCGLFLAVFLVSLFSIVFNRDYLVTEYLRTVIIGRLFTFTALVLNLLVILMWLPSANEKSVKKLLYYGLFTTFTFVILGYWQLISKQLGIPFFIDTRDWMHGVPAALRSVFPSRITSIAEEPNFLSPILMECLILIALLIRSKFWSVVLLGMTTIIVVLSFSGGAYVNFALLCAFVFFYIFLKTATTGKTRISHFVIMLAVVFFIGVIVYFGALFLEFIYYKLQHEASGGSSRSQFMISFSNLIAESSITQLIFGHGLGTMSVLDSFGMRSEDYLFRITNNYVLDMFWEGGAIGVFLIFSFFTALILPGIKHGFLSRYYFLGALMGFQILVTSSYRSEYLSTHFTWAVLITLCIYKLAEFKRNVID